MYTFEPREEYPLSYMVRIHGFQIGLANLNKRNDEFLFRPNSDFPLSTSELKVLVEELERLPKKLG